MGLLSSLKNLVGGSGATIDLASDGAASGTAVAAVTRQIVTLRESLELQIRRQSSDTYLEAVVRSDRLDAAEAILNQWFGAAAKGFGERASFAPELQTAIDSRGGVDRSQCIYLQRYEDSYVAFAALWPWSDGEHVTMKVGIYDEPIEPRTLE